MLSPSQALHQTTVSQHAHPYSPLTHSDRINDADNKPVSTDTHLRPAPTALGIRRDISPPRRLDTWTEPSSEVHDTLKSLPVTGTTTRTEVSHPETTSKASHYATSRNTRSTRSRNRRSSFSTPKPDNMRFSTAYSRPSLTPLGQRLLSLSERKLYDLDAPVGARESGTALLREVLVRQTVRSAWDAVDHGRPAVVSDWSRPNALGLDVIGEDEEDEDEAENRAGALEEKEDKWFEELLSELGEEEASTPYWNVKSSEPLPSPRTVLPVSTTTSTSFGSFSASRAYSSTINDDAVVSVHSASGIQVLEVDFDFDDAVSDCSDCSDCSSLSHIEYLDSPDLDHPSFPPPTLPLTPADRHHLTRESLATLEEIDECNDLTLPPPLHRSWSSSSSDTEPESECHTPQFGCEELEDVSEVEWGADSQTSESDAVGGYFDDQSAINSKFKGPIFSAWPGRLRLLRGC